MLEARRPGMSNFLLPDTDVPIDFLRRYPEAIQLVETSDHEFWISAVSVAELYVGVRGKEREVLDQLILARRTNERCGDGRSIRRGQKAMWCARALSR